ncbi:MAG: cytochrome c [Acidimicrobiales bacterium]
MALAASVLLGACGGGGSEPPLSKAGARGKEVAGSGGQGCLGCHTTTGGRSTGPTWKDLAGSQVELSTGRTVTADDAYLRRSILHSREQVVKGYPNIMPVYAGHLSDQEVRDLIAYLHDLSDQDEGPARGAERCHLPSSNTCSSDGAMAVPAPDLAALRLLGDRVRPLSAAAERLLPVPEPLAPLLPLGGLQRGAVVASTGAAATSFALALAGPTTQAGSWVAVVGLADLGLLAAAELGVCLERALLVAEPEPARWAPTVAALLDAVDLVLVRPPGRLAPSVHRRLVARARERGAVLLQVGGPVDAWGEQPDLAVRTGRPRWEGVERGHGRLRARRVEVEVAGRRAAVRTRRGALWLPGPDGRLAVAAPAVDQAASAPAAAASARGVA